MQREQILSLLTEAAQAADTRNGCLLDHKDLRLMLGRLVAVAGNLLNENDALKDRLTRRRRELREPGASMAGKFEGGKFEGSPPDN